MPHSVRRHLRVEIDAYDRAIRSFVPGYEDMLRAAAREVAAAAAGGAVLELGAGSGAFSEALLERPEVGAVDLVDADAEMLGRARVRLARFGGRARRPGAAGPRTWRRTASTRRGRAAISPNGRRRTRTFRSRTNWRR